MSRHFVCKHLLLYFFSFSVARRFCFHLWIGVAECVFCCAKESHEFSHIHWNKKNVEEAKRMVFYVPASVRRRVWSESNTELEKTEYTVPEGRLTANVNANAQAKWDLFAVLLIALKNDFCFSRVHWIEWGFITLWRSSVSAVYATEWPFEMCVWISERTIYACVCFMSIYLPQPHYENSSEQFMKIFHWHFTFSRTIAIHRIYSSWKMYCSKENNEMCKWKMKMNVENNRRGGKVYL